MRAAFALIATVAVACGGEDGPPVMGLDAGSMDAAAPDTSRLPYAREVVSFTAGTNAGYGQDRMPAIVLGPPDGRGVGAGSIDTLSLGLGGEIVLGFGDRTITDGPGADLVVFENAFWVGGTPGSVYAELGEVAVSADGVDWHAFRCEPIQDGRIMWPGCAGWSPALAYDPIAAGESLDPAVTGGDAFDLADVGLAEARFVRVRDAGTSGEAPTAGFDLDAVALIHHRR